MPYFMQIPAHTVALCCAYKCQSLINCYISRKLEMTGMYLMHVEHLQYMIMLVSSIFQLKLYAAKLEPNPEIDSTYQANAFKLDTLE